MNTATNPATLETIASTLRALPGVTIVPTKGNETTHLNIYIGGRFIAVAHMELSRGALTGRISVARDTSRKLGPMVYAALLGLGGLRAL